MKRKSENAQRLAYALERNADPHTLSVLAHYLNYDPQQLKTDIQDLSDIIDQSVHSEKHSKSENDYEPEL